MGTLVPGDAIAGPAQEPSDPREYRGPMDAGVSRASLRIIHTKAQSPPSPSNQQEVRRDKRPLPKPFRKHKVVVVPTIRSEPNVGTTFGLRTRYVYRLPNVSHNRIQIDLALRLSTKLVQNHEFQLRLRDLLRREELFQVAIRMVDDPVFPYMGIGNNHDLSNVNLDVRHYLADRLTVGPAFSYQEPVLTVKPGHWYGRTPGFLRWIVGMRFEIDRLRSYPNSLLEHERPWEQGIKRKFGAFGGLSWDSRDNEWGPTWGGQHEATIHLVGPWLGANVTFARINFTARLFRPLGTKKLVFANMLLMDGIIGNAPIVELGEFGGLVQHEGIGGLYIGRGFFRRRFVGNAKIYDTTEIRFEPYEFKLFRWFFSPGLKAFMDVGKVFGKNQSIIENMQISGGGGVYFVWDRFFVMRLDVGVSREDYGIYVTSSHTF